MNASRMTWTLAAAMGVLAACAPAPGTPVASSSPTPAVPSTPGTTPGATTAPSAIPTAGSPVTPAPSATASPAGPVAPAFDLTNGALLRKYDFEGLAGVYYDFSRDDLWVVDDDGTELAERGLLARRFKRDGTFDATIKLHREGERAPEEVFGFTFDLSGIPTYTHHFDDAFSLRQLYTATVENATRLPSVAQERAGVAAVAAEGNVFTIGVLRLDPDVVFDYDTKDREVLYTRAEQDLEMEANFRIRDPLEPTTRMVAAPSGMLYLFGPLPGGGLGVKRLDKNQALVDVPIPLSRIPDQAWAAPNGDILVADETTGSTPARIRRFLPDGVLVGETDVRLENGDVVFDVAGLTFDAKGRIVIAGSAIASDLKVTTGLFDFDR